MSDIDTEIVYTKERLKRDKRSYKPDPCEEPKTRMERRENRKADHRDSVVSKRKKRRKIAKDDVFIDLTDFRLNG